MRNTRHLFVLLAWMLCSVPMSGRAAGFVGESPAAGTDYYLYNVYQAKFLGYGSVAPNWWGTEVVALPFGNAKVLRCTLEDAGGGTYKLNTHFSLDNGGEWNGSADNWLFRANDSIPVVNAVWGSSESDRHVRDAATFSITEADEGYYITTTSGSLDLMFNGKYDWRGVCCKFKAKGENAALQDMSLWRFIPVSEYEAMTAKNRFTITAMNVDGMPKSVKILGVYTLNLNSDAKEADGATAIGSKLVGMGYDYIGVSEDFNYNDEIMAQIGGSYNQMTHRGGISISASTYTNYIAQKTLFDTDGLNFFYKKTLGATGEYWTVWNEHYGYTDHEADGLINKGYRYYCLTLPDGTTKIDVYILHMDAGSDEGDNNARATQLTQLANAILATNNRRPIIVMGDTNCRYTRDQVTALFMDVINADSRFTVKDIWAIHGQQGVAPLYGGWAQTAGDLGYRRGEVVDKIFFINNTDSGVRLVSETYCQDLSFVNGSGEPLADHWPCVGMFSYHAYDPSIDDVAEEDLSQNGVYLRNVGTGQFMKAAGWWGTRAYLGDYGEPIDLQSLGDGKYRLATGRGNGYIGGSNTKPYFDGAAMSWTVVQKGDYYLFVNGGKALGSGWENRYAQNGVGPNTHYVDGLTLNVNDVYQQWEILTLDELKAEMLTASESSPVNCTYLIGSANFDRNDGTINTHWTWEEGDDFDNHGSRSVDGYVTDHLANQVYEVFIGSGSGLGEGSNNYFKLYQCLNGLPAGKYKVTCQAFYRDGGAGSSSTSGLAFLYANGYEYVTANLPRIHDARYVQSSSLGVGTETNAYGGYVPNDKASASYYFSKGLYPVELEVNVGSTGTLSIGIQKDDRDKGTQQWTCFDNFQLFYYGLTPVPPASGEAGYYYNVDGGAFLSTNGTDNAVVSGWASRVILDPDAGIQWTKVETGTHYKLQSSSNYLGLIDGDDIYTAWRDRTSDTETQFDIVADGSFYTLKHVNTANTQVGWSGDMTTKLPIFKLSTNDKELRGNRWAVLTSAQYDIVRSNVAAAYSTRRSLWPLVRSARNTSVVDTSDEMAVWESPAATTAQLNTMANQLRAKLTTRLDDATKTTPIDLSYLIENADFSGAINTGWTNDGFEIYENYYPASSANGPTLGDLFGQRWVAWNSALPNSDLYQIISAANIPDGTYKLTADVRVSRWGSGATGISLYAKAGTNDDVVANGDIATETNTRLETPVFQVNDGEALKVGIKIQGTESVNWLAFDNFHLYYVGPNHSTVLEDIDEDAVNETLNLYGTWRTSEQDELTALVGSNVKSIMLNTATVSGPLTIPTASQPNIVIYATNASDVTNTQNVVVNGTCANFVLTDKRDFSAPVGFTATHITYNRTNTGGYNTVCLPFGFSYDQISALFGAGTRVYVYRRKGVTAGGDEYLQFQEVESGDEVEPGHACLIRCDVTSWTNSNRAGTFSVSGQPMLVDEQDIRDEDDNIILHIDADPVRGSFLDSALGVGYYKLNSSGTYFVRSTSSSTITPFRFYVDPSTFPAEAKQLRFFVDDIDGVHEVTDLVNQVTARQPLYDLSGRRIRGNPRRGIYIRNGQKICKK